MKSYWYQHKNIGDTLTPIIVEHFTGQKVECVDRKTHGKLLAVGSIMSALTYRDVVWGAGVMRETDKFPLAKYAKFLAVRGKLSEKILGVEVGVYGDPALLLPLIYNPKIEKKYDVGYIPHYVDTPFFPGIINVMDNPKYQIIDVLKPWKEFIDKVLECKTIVSSSLHGVIIAEAYGIPAKWEVYSNKVIGNGFKFRDYLTGTGREEQGPGEFPPIKNLVEIQANLINSLMKHYGK